MPPSISSHCSSVMLPARFSIQYFQTSEPEPRYSPVPVAAQHRAGRHVDRRDAHADRAHDQAGRGLVAAAEQHRAVDRMAAQQLLRLHREEIAIEHGGGLHERLGQRHRRQLDRKAAGLQHAALDVLGARAQMRVAGVDLAPGIDDADDRLAGPVLGVVAELACSRERWPNERRSLTPSQRWLRRSSGRLRFIEITRGGNALYSVPKVARPIPNMKGIRENPVDVAMADAIALKRRGVIGA